MIFIAEISVVIPAYNCERTLRECIASVQKSKFRDIEIIVVDDGSKDSTREIARAFGNVRLVTQKNLGPAAARNNGAKNAKGRLLHFLDSDVAALPNTFSIGIEAMKSKNADSVNGIYSKEPANKGFFPMYKALLEYYTFHRGDPEKYSIFIASNALIKKRVFESLGGFNTTARWARDVTRGLENDEFGHRLSQKYKNIVETRMQVRHNFPSFKRLAQTYFRRTFTWIKLFLHRRKFSSTGPTSASVGISTMAGFLSLSALLGFLHPAFVLIGAIMLMGFFLGYVGFYSFALREKGIIFSFKSFLASYFFSWVIGLSAMLSLLSAIFEKASGKSDYEFS